MTIEKLLSTDKLSEDDLCELEKLSDAQLEEYFRTYLVITRAPVVSEQELELKAEEKLEKKKLKAENKKLSLLERAQLLAKQHGAEFTLKDFQDLPSKM